ncbi:hypothetical protein [Haladaptatus sp. CMAA 1911]
MIQDEIIRSNPPTPEEVAEAAGSDVETVILARQALRFNDD